MALAVAVFGLPGQVAAATSQYILEEDGAGGSALDQQTPLPDAFEPEPESFCDMDIFDQTKSTLAPFVCNSSLKLRLRTYYFNQSTDNKPDKSAWTLGGWLDYQSGWFADRLRVEAAVYTSQPLWAPDDRDGSRLLAPGQEAITVLGQANLDLRIVDGTELTLYRQDLDLPFINRRDNRMVPNTFEAYMLNSRTLDKLKFVAGHVTAIKPRDGNSFQSMTGAAGIKGHDKGVSVAGVLVEPFKDVSLGLVTEYGWDYMNAVYAEATTGWKLTEKSDLSVSAQYARQTSVGDELGGGFDTYFWGGGVTLGYHGAVFTAAVTGVDDSSGVVNPWGGYPGYTSMMIENFNRAGEWAWLVRASYDCTRAGLEGLSGMIRYGRGYTPDNGSNASPDEAELDIAIDWRFKEGPLQGMWLRLHGGFLDQWGHPQAADATEIRLVLNYDFSIL